MPATEQTWYNQKLLHVIFGVSSLVLLGATIWTLAWDHYRPWKVNRATQIAIETEYGKYKILEAETARFQQGLDELKHNKAVAKRQLPNRSLIKKFEASAAAMVTAKHLKDFDAQKIGNLYARMQKLDADEARTEARAELFTALQEVIIQVEFNEKNLADRKKAFSSERDAASSMYQLAIRDSLPVEEVARRLKQTKEREAEVEEVITEVQEIKAARLSLVAIFTELMAPVDDANKALVEYRTTVDRLHQANVDRSGEGWSSYFRWVLDLPILDIGAQTRPDQIWLPDLTINYNLRDVARFDRCITCHRALTTTEPGLATTAAYPQQQILRFEMTPVKPDSEKPISVKPVSSKPDEVKDNEPLQPTLLSVYGMQLAPRGLLKPTDVTIIVPPKTFAAKAGLKTADVLASVDGRPVLNSAHAEGLLLSNITWGESVVIEVRRGLPHPYSAHPRLDLYGTDGSPHPFGKIGCTVCHDGQGPATAFQHAEHTPSTTADENRWRKERGWYANHFWEFPQQSKRFLESGCLKCHHSVTELEPSDRFPDPPAPKLMHGYNLVRQYGCFGCHDISGNGEPGKTIGPDLRIEPDYFAWATILEQAIAPQIAKRSADHTGAIDNEQKLVVQRDALMVQKNAATKAKQQEQADNLTTKITAIEEQIKSAVIARRAVQTPYDELQEMLSLSQAIRAVPEDSQSRSQLQAMLNADAARVVSSILINEAGILENRPAPLLSSAEHAIAPRLADITSPGAMRKVGPSLRYAGSKLDRVFLRDWLSNPQHFRPDTRMPKIFGNFDHLTNQDGSPTESSVLAKRLESVEIRAITEYLLSASNPFKFIEPPANIVPIETDEQKQEQLVRGRDLFVTRGCLACHSIRDEGRIDEDADPDEDVHPAIAALGKADQDQGPDLSRIGAKLASRGSESKRNPQRWLYSWLQQPSLYHARTKMPDLFLEPLAVSNTDESNTDESNTDESGSDKRPVQFTDPAADIAAYLLSLQGATPWEPVKGEDNDEALDELALMHLSKAFRKSLAEDYLKTGIPASKRASLKGDEVEMVTDGGDDIHHQKLLYVGRRSISKYGCFGCHDIPGFEDAKPIGTGLADWGRKGTNRLAFEQITKYHGIAHGGGHGEGSHGSSDAESEQQEKYFHHRLQHGDRDGFLWQKLREPRSYDYKKTETKSFNEWLRMPKFNFSGEEIEAVMTFVLGLVAEPPAEQYLFRPDPRRSAIIEGRAVLRKYNCQGCHVLEAERLDLAIEPGVIAAPEQFNNYEFLRPLFTPEQLKDSQVQDRRGRLYGSVYGLDDYSEESPTPYLLTDREDRSSIYEDDPDFPYDGPFFRPFVLWKNAVVDGRDYFMDIKLKPLILSESDVLRRVPPRGGVATRLMMPLVYQQIKPGRDNLTGNATRALVAPPLIGEGRKVQTAWLHDFLLDPYPIRPAVQLRMPKFNMSPEEAAKLVAYFAAVDRVEHPYTFDPRTRDGYLEKKESRHPNHLGDAMKIVAGVCSECHKIGDFSPQGDVTAMAPNLDRVHRRLRPEYLRDWIASPKSILPYTEMPVNFSHEQLKYQQYYHGTSAEQIGAVVDLLLNYDQYTKNQVPLSEMVKKAKAAAGPKSEGDEPAE